MGKKTMTYEEAQDSLKALKVELSEAKADMTSFLKENKLKRNVDHSNHEKGKIAKKFKTFKAAINRLEKERDELKEFTKANKPQKERASKYQYPEDLSADDRKKFRAQMRSNAKRAGAKDVDDYLANQEEYDKVLESKKAESTAKKKKKDKKKKDKGEEDSDKPKKKKKKKDKQSSDD
jgi:hypothetical protein